MTRRSWIKMLVASGAGAAAMWSISPLAFGAYLYGFVVGVVVVLVRERSGRG